MPEGRDLSRGKAENEHGLRRNAPPTKHIPPRANEADFRPQGQIQNLARIALVEPLRHDE